MTEQIQVLRNKVAKFIGGPSDGLLIALAELPKVYKMKLQPSVSILDHPQKDSIIEFEVALYHLATDQELSIEGVSPVYEYFYEGTR